MSATIQELSSHLDAHDVRHKVRDDNTILTGFGGLKHFRDGDGDAHLAIVIQLEEDGEYLKVFAPGAYNVPLDHAGPVLQACAMVQWRTKLVQFEYDASDGELRPIVEFPLEDAPVTERQLMRCVIGLVQIVDRYNSVIVKARDEGVVEFDDDDEESVDMLSRLLGGFSPEMLAEALRRSDAHRRRN